MAIKYVLGLQGGSLTTALVQLLHRAEKDIICLRLQSWESGRNHSGFKALHFSIPLPLLFFFLLED